MPFQKGQSGNPNGKRAGTLNKNTQELRDMILSALDEADEGGGVEYLKKRALDTPASFLSLIGKVLPQNVNVTGAVTLSMLMDEARQRVKARHGQSDAG